MSTFNRNMNDFNGCGNKADWNVINVAIAIKNKILEKS